MKKDITNATQLDIFYRNSQLKKYINITTSIQFNISEITYFTTKHFLNKIFFYRIL